MRRMGDPHQSFQRLDKHIVHCIDILVYCGGGLSTSTASWKADALYMYNSQRESTVCSAISVRMSDPKEAQCVPNYYYLSKIVETG